MRLCEQLLDKVPARRPASAAEVARALEAISVGDPGRRRARRISKVAATEIATETQAPWTRFVALATPPLDDDGAPIPPEASALDALAARAAEQGVRLSTLHDGALLAVVAEADESEGARRAAGLALRIAELIPGAVVVVSGARGGDERTAIDSALDGGTASIEIALREAMFSVITGPTRERAVRVDDLTAALLRPPFRVERARGVSWLVAEAR